MQVVKIDEHFCRVTKASILTGKESSMLLPVSKGEIDDMVDTGTLVQDAFPHLSSDVREFLISGITPDEWNATFPKGDE